MDESDGDQYDNLIMFQKMSQCTGRTENPYNMKVWSQEQIPFIVPTSMQEKISRNVNDLFILENEIAQAIPSDEHCRVCGAT